MRLYQTLVTYALPVVAAAALLLSPGNSQKIDGYSVTPTQITQDSQFSYVGFTTWTDSDGDGEFDTKKHRMFVPTRGPFSVERPFKDSDRKLTDDLLRRLE
jgi:hypothetical protein